MCYFFLECGKYFNFHFDDDSNIKFAVGGKDAEAREFRHMVRIFTNIYNYIS